MPRLPTVTGPELVRALQRAGFRVRRQSGSHVVMTDEAGRQAVVPIHGNRDLKPGTARGIIADAGLTVAELIALLR